jgi:UDP-glucose 4-epimerase
MNVLITGGCGFIGSNIASFHLAKGDHVHVVDDLSTGSLENIAPFKDHPLFRFEQTNIVAWPNINETIQWADRIYHMAAVIGIFRVLAEPIHVVETNIQGSEYLFRAVANHGKNKRLILASSSCVYGDAVGSEEDGDLIIRQQGNPLLAYAVSKLADETIGLAYHKEMQLPITIVRLFNVIGPRQTGLYGMVVPRFVKQACKNEPITIFGDGTQTRSFCDVRDTIAAINLLAENKNTIGEIFNVGSDEEISINDLAALVRKEAQSSSTFQYVPYEKAYGGDFNDTLQRRPNIKKLVQYTGFEHQWNLKKTITELIAYAKEHHNQP